MSHSLPDYARRLDALHAAVADDFDAIVASLKPTGDEQILDAGCGTGFFSNLLATPLTAGQVHALDSSAAFLDVAGARLAGLVAKSRVRLVEGDVEELPFDAGSLDVVWSAHSMQSYDDVSKVLAEFRRVLRPGGVCAVLESDAMHSIMLPWPAGVELALRRAEQRLLGDLDERQGAYFPRYAGKLFREAGFEDFAMRPTLIYRREPFSNELASYVRMYCDDLLDRTRSDLAPDAVQAVERLAEDRSESPSSPGFEPYFASLQMLITGRSGGGAG